MGTGRFFKRHKNTVEKNDKQSNLKSSSQKIFNPQSSHWLPIGAVSVLLLTGAAAAGELNLASISDRLTGNAGNSDLAANTPDTQSGQFNINQNSGSNQSDDQSKQNENNTDKAKNSGDINFRASANGEAEVVVNPDGSVTQSYQSDDGQTKIEVNVKSGSGSTGETDLNTKTKIKINSDSHTSVYVNGQQQNSGGGNDNNSPWGPRYNR